VCVCVCVWWLDCIELLTPLLILFIKCCDDYCYVVPACYIMVKWPDMCLSLGEKLDYKACESLEEILKRVQFKVIDLEQTNLDEDVRKSHFKKNQPCRSPSLHFSWCSMHSPSVTVVFCLQSHSDPLFHSYCNGRMWSACHGFSDYSRCPLV